ncbi:MAG TPA: DUF362 domain-containing protein [Planctomycetota bacterium]|nr:DUF362 domain-containing protein [Planctomycetota bacterium]
MKAEMSRRSFVVGTAVVAGSAFGLGLWRRSRSRGRVLKAAAPCALALGPGKLVVARGGDPAQNVRRALDAAGGLKALVKGRQTVVIKPNMAWDLPPDTGANANPATVAAVVALCREASPDARVVVFDRTMARDPAGPYRTSGIADAVRKAGGTVHVVDENRFHEVAIPDAFALERWSFYELVLFQDQVDVLINIPAAKTHSTSGLTLGMKNVFGMVGGERGQLHQQIHEKIADLNRVVKVDLTILDATRVMFRNGPNSPRRSDVDATPERAQRIVVGTDPVAVDAYAAKELFGRDPADVGFIRLGAEAGLGDMKFTVREA